MANACEEAEARVDVILTAGWLRFYSFHCIHMLQWTVDNLASVLMQYLKHRLHVCLLTTGL